MRRSRLMAVATSAAAVAAISASTMVPAAQAAPIGTKSLASVLDVAHPKFDHNWNDFDILTKAAATVLAVKPGSLVAKLADGNFAITCFVPTDRAFRDFAERASGKKLHTEKQVFDTIVAYATVLGGGKGAQALPKAVGVVESVLLYHCTPGTIPASVAIKADGAKLTMVNGGTVTVAVRRGHIILKDAAPAYKDPQVIVPNINVGNKQIAHAINRVLVPLPLTPAA